MAYLQILVPTGLNQCPGAHAYPNSRRFQIKKCRDCRAPARMPKYKVHETRLTGGPMNHSAHPSSLENAGISALAAADLKLPESSRHPTSCLREAGQKVKLKRRCRAGVQTSSCHGAERQSKLQICNRRVNPNNSACAANAVSTCSYFGAGCARIAIRRTYRCAGAECTNSKRRPQQLSSGHAAGCMH